MILYHNDHLGTPQKMTASNGAVVWSAYYSSFGKAHVAPESTVVNNLRFPGQYFDGESGLCWNWFRYYDPEVGRYTTKDKLLEMIGTRSGSLIKSFIYFPSRYSLYPYAQSNSINNMDELGLFWCPEGQHLEKDFSGFAECMAFDTNALAACTACVAFAWTGVGSPLGVGMCLACLSFELHCIGSSP